MPTGELIKKIRKEKKMTQKQLSEKCGIADSNIRKYENGKQFPKWETLERIAKALDVDVFDLIEYDEGPTDDQLLEIYGEQADKEGLEQEVLEKFRLLNIEGQRKAIDQVEILTKIQEYRKENN